MYLSLIMIVLLLGCFAREAAAIDLGDVNAPLTSAGYLTSRPALDGKIEEGEWTLAGGMTGFHRLSTEVFLAHEPYVRIGFDERALYFAVTVPLPGGAKPQASVSTRDGPVWTDDSVEIFLDPRHDHKTSYQFVVNSVGARADLLNQNLGWNGEWTAQASVTEEDWSVELAIPWPTLGMDGPTEEGALGFNIGWNRRLPTVLTGSWAHLVGSFHQPAKFGHLLLPRHGPILRLQRLAETGRITFLVSTAPAAKGGGGVIEVKLSVRRGDAVIGRGSASLTAKGTARLTVGLPIQEGRPRQGDYHCQVLAHVAGEDRPVARLSGIVHVSPPLIVTLHKYFIEGALLVEINATGLGEALSALEVMIRTADGHLFARQHQKATADASASFKFNVAKLPAGPHTVEVLAADAAGGRLAAKTVPLVKPEQPEWLDSQAGISDEVMPPWTPIEVETREDEKGAPEAGQSPITIKVSGRAYRFDSMPFPDHVTTRDASILAGPISLKARVDGEDVKWRGMLRMVKETPAQVVLSGAANAGALRVSSTVTLDFDGNARVDLRLSATRPVRLDRLVLEAPLKREHARYLYHFPGSWGSARNARALPAKGWASPFVPYVWLGDEDRGFCLYTESDEHWRPPDPRRAVEVTAGREVVALRMNLIGKPIQLTPTEPTGGLPYTFGFMATPIKTPEKDVWDYRICHYGSYGLERQTVRAASSLRYPAQGNLSLDAGTLEIWARVRFDPKAPITDYDTRGVLNRDLLKISGADEILGLYWNIDDRGMRLYLKRGSTHPVVAGASSDWREGEWHHLALSWGEELRVYVDGELTVHRPWQGSVSAPAEQVTLEFGGTAPGFDVDEIRTADVQREPRVTEQPFTVDEHTLLLDSLDRLAKKGRLLSTAPTRGTPGEITGRGELVAAKFGHALALASGEPTLMLDYLKDLGVRTIVFHEHWTEYENYTDTVGHQEDLKSLVRACHERGFQLLLYFGYLMANACPEWDAYHDEVLVMPQQGEYHRQPEQKAYAVCYRSVWQDFLADGIDKLIDKYDIDGVYLDGTEYPWACRNLHHGCGYVRPDGTIAPTYAIFAAREMVRRIYTIIKSKKPEGQINIHNSTVMTIPSLGWATSSWDGEQFGGISRGVDVEELLPLDAFRCEFMGRQWGVPAEFLCYDRPYTHHEALSFTLLHDVLVRGSGPSLEEESTLWKTMDAFGRKQSRFLPYWNNADYCHVTSDHCCATLYAQPRRGVMCVVSNLGAVPAKVKVSLDLAKLGLPAAVQAEDALTRDPISVVKGEFVVPLESFDYVLVKVVPQ